MENARVYEVIIFFLLLSLYYIKPFFFSEQELAFDAENIY